MSQTEESVNVGDTVATLTTNDLDDNSVSSYSIKDGENKDYFTIDENSGEIKLTQAGVDVINSDEGVDITSIALTFQFEGDINKTISYHKQAIEIFEEYSDSFQVANCQLNISEAFRVFESQTDYTNSFAAGVELGQFATSHFEDPSFILLFSCVSPTSKHPAVSSSVLPQ